MNIYGKNGGGYTLAGHSSLHERPPSNGANRWDKTMKPIDNFITESEFKELNIGERQFEDSSSVAGGNNEVFIA